MIVLLLSRCIKFYIESSDALQQHLAPSVSVITHASEMRLKDQMSQQDPSVAMLQRERNKTLARNANNGEKVQKSRNVKPKVWFLSLELLILSGIN